LQALKHSNKNKNSKEPSPQNVNALKEALSKIRNPKSEILNKPEIPDSKSENNPSTFVPASAGKKEIPEETLRKILKGE
jgi:hypothetical protein